MSNYFSRLPDFEYVSRLPGARISDYITVKNLFKKGELRKDIFQNVAFFTKYQILGNDRPDNVAFEVYDDSSLDWLVLTCNNVINIQTEWPLPQQQFDNYVLDKYGDYNTLYNGIHHYETVQEKNSQGVTIVPAGLEVQSNYSVSYYDYFIDSQVTKNNLVVPITNYEYEERLENNKRNIFLLKPRYLNVVFDDLDEMMTYEKGSTQYVSENLVRGDNIRLYS
jgi:Base plate wedge protein 53